MADVSIQTVYSDSDHMLVAGVFFQKVFSYLAIVVTWNLAEHGSGIDLLIQLLAWKWMRQIQKY